MPTPSSSVRLRGRSLAISVALASLVGACSDDQVAQAPDASTDTCLTQPDADADPPPRLPLGEACTQNLQCESERCEELLFDKTICTQDCTTTCPGANLACFKGRCVPDTFCEDPFGTGLGEGPGCTGTYCDACSPNATCTERLGVFNCVCNPGFQGDGYKCGDINECASRPEPCDFAQHCFQTPDGIVCNCPESLNRCDPDALCQNTLGTYICICPPGFVGEGLTCDDLDECELNLDNCAPEATCTNTHGSFRCACNDGFVGNGLTCADVDECTQGLDNCAPEATCTNLPGTFECSCKSGYQGDGVTCADIQECALNLDNCSVHAVCVNLPGSFSCGCGVGFEGDGITCTDIDECSNDTDACDPNADCQNIPGFYTCTCRPGFSGNGFSCTPI
jgi:hypothetical protein